MSARGDLTLATRVAIKRELLRAAAVLDARRAKLTHDGPPWTAGRGVGLQESANLLRHRADRIVR